MFLGSGPWHKQVAFLPYFIGVSVLALSLGPISTFSVLLPIGLALLQVPALTYSLLPGGRSNETRVLTSVLGPLVLVNYAYVLRMGYPSGFGDIHTHIYQADILLTAQGTIDFSRAQTLYFNFVGLYIVSWFTDAVTALGMPGIAGVIPPIVNAAVMLLFYLIVRKCVSAKVAMLALVLFGWENTTLLFGHEFRTQTLGTLLTLGALLLYMVPLGVNRNRAPMRLAVLFFLFALATSSFVSIVFAFIVFGSLLLLPVLIGPKGKVVSVSQFGLLVSFVLLYVLYVSDSPTTVFGSIGILIQQAFLGDRLSGPSVGQSIYGPIVQVFFYFYWGLFVVLALPTLWNAFRQRSVGELNLYFPFLCVFGAGIGLTTISPLSAARGYTLGAALIGAVIARAFVHMSRDRNPRRTNYIRILASTVVVFFVATSVAKLPAYILPGATAIRGPQVIDDVPFWRTGSIDSATAKFLGESAQGRTVHPHVIELPYMLLQLADEGVHLLPSSFDSRGVLILGTFDADDLVLVRDAYAGGEFAYQQDLPTVSTYASFSLLYSNGDYKLYGVLL